MTEVSELPQPKLRIRRRPADEHTNEVAREIVASVEARAKAKERAALKARLKGYWNNVVAIVVLGAMAFVGYRAWKLHQAGAFQGQDAMQALTILIDDLRGMASQL